MRAQIQQMFIFLTAILVIGATIFLGVRLIGGLSETACQANDVSFKQEIRDMVIENKVFGSTNPLAAISPPCDAVAICFVDAAAVGNAAFRSTDKSLQARVQKGVKTNVYLQTRDSMEEQGYYEEIILRGPRDAPALEPLCIPAVGGKFKFSTKGYGRYLQINVTDSYE